jgi:hypothetical protein
VVFSDALNPAMSPFPGNLGQENPANRLQSSQCPSEAITTFTLDEKISVLTGNRRISPANEDQAPKYMLDNRLLYRLDQRHMNSNLNLNLTQEMHKIEENCGISQISQKSDFLTNQGREHAFKEQHHMKALYLTKIN